MIQLTHGKKKKKWEQFFFVPETEVHSKSKSEVLRWSENIKITQFSKRKDPLVQTLLLFHLIVCLSLADGDGFQDHLLPVCLDDKCQRGAIFLAKSGTKEVRNTHAAALTDVTS